MGLTALHTLLWLVTALTLTTQDLMRLSESPKITAECGKRVTLNCNTTSSRRGLSIKQMHWYLNNVPLCSVNNDGNISYSNHSGDFSCEYTHGQLTLFIGKVQPLESGNTMPYKCKIISNKGVAHKTTIVELQECCSEIVQGVWTDEGPSCTFNHVYPDGDVHWFNGFNKVSNESLHRTTKQVVQGGWLTIHSYLKHEESDVPFNCSLMSTKSGRYIASTLVHKTGVQKTSPQTRNGVRSWRPMRTFFYISILLAVSLKWWIYQSKSTSLGVQRYQGQGIINID